MYEIDSWDDEEFKVFINGAEVSSDYMSHHNRTWSKHATDEQDGGIEIDNIGSSGQYWLDHDEADHYTVEATIDENGQVQLGFGSTLNQSLGDESWGIDNVTITASDNWNNEGISTNEDTILTIDANDLLANDTDADGDTLTITEVNATADTHGTVSIDADGNVVFTPETNYNGEASFEYTVSDGQGGTDTATVNLNIASDGNDNETVVSVTPTENADAITETSEADTIDALGGNDYIDAGAGNDTVAFDGTDTIDGGEGYDIVQADDDMSLDFDNLGSLSNIEEIDLSSGNHKIENINAEDILSMTDEDNELRITGDESDSISIDNSLEKTDETHEEDGKTFDIYKGANDGDPTLYVQNDIDVDTTDDTGGL